MNLTFGDSAAAANMGKAKDTSPFDYVRPGGLRVSTN